MKKLIIILTLLLSACSVVPHHKSGYVLTDKEERINLTGGHVFVDMHELHIIDKTADFTLMKKEIKEIHLNY